MPGVDQYLRLRIGGANFLLHSAASLAIEQRENLILNDNPGSPVSAWRTAKTARWPAYGLDENLRPAVCVDWQRAVFVNASPYPLGVIVDEVQLLSQIEVRAEPFTPLGAAPSSGGHIFSGAWVSSGGLMLVFDPMGLVGYLRGLGE